MQLPDRRIWRLLLAVYLPIATAYYLAPAGAETATEATGMGTLWLHVVGLAVLGVLMAASYPHAAATRPFLLTSIVIAYGILLETAQLVVPARTFTLADIAANTAGGAAGATATSKLV